MKRPITPRGNAALRKELKSLKAMRPAIAEAIEVARAHGDLSENADYDAAKEKSGMVEAKIRDIETKLSHADIIDPTKLTGFNKVVFGVTVKIEDLDSGEEKTYSIYGEDETEIEKGWISIESPLGKGLIGKELGDVAKLNLPGGAREYEVMEIYVDYEWDGSLEDEDE
ncbi:MAG: transcription elongation factor GreA [Bdellovibrionales bacterium]|nr:transcription elongation factor GreA [Bdellovibrionales bacterium]